MLEESNPRPGTYVSPEYVTGVANVHFGNNEVKNIQKLPKLDEAAGCRPTSVCQP